MDRKNVDSAVNSIARKTKSRPLAGIVLGSGWAPLADEVTDAAVITYSDIPGFPSLGVDGHAGKLVIGDLYGCPVALLCGRKHYYEDLDHHHMTLPVLVLKALGCETLLLTNASGAVNPAIPAGSIVLVSDHINLSGVSPLADEAYFDDPFVDLTDAYDPALRQMMLAAADRARVSLPTGVYACFTGPHFETPAEIRMAGVIGADLVGMSTVSETILARRLGMRVTALSIATNAAAGLSDEPLMHDAVQKVAAEAFETGIKLLRQFIPALKEFQP